MALASYGREPHTEPALLPTLRELVYVTGDGGFVVAPIEWSELAKRRSPGGELLPAPHSVAGAVG
jgi:carbamoyltransferase